jgi:hypothetical protein
MIPTNYYYLLVDILCLSGPFFLSFQKRLPFFKYWKALFAGTLAMIGSNASSTNSNSRVIGAYLRGIILL